MTDKELDELWKEVEHIGRVDLFSYDRMVALGSVFGKMSSAIKEQREIYIILSKTQPEIVDFTYYIDEKKVAERVEDLNKIAKRQEYWYITMHSNFRNSGNDGED